MKSPKPTKNRKKSKIIIISLVVLLILILSAIGINILQTQQRIRSFLTDLAEIKSVSAVEGNEERKSAVAEYKKNDYFKKTILSNLESYKNMRLDENGANWDGLTNAVRLVGYLEMLDYSDPDVNSAFLQLVIDELSGYINADDFEATARTIHLLDTYGIHTEEIKEKFLTYLHDTQTLLFSGSGSITMFDYSRIVNAWLDGSYYVTILECYPYDEMIAYIQENGQLVVAQDGLGGYYDSLSSKYKDESYWVDPLANEKVYKGEVGTYQYTESHSLIGDFRVKVTSKYWYMTDKSDPNNSLNATLYYKDDYVMGDYQDITIFLGKVTNENCYQIPRDTDKHMFFVLEKDAITIWANGLFAIAYE